MMNVPETVKTYFGSQHLFDSINTLWEQNGKRPYTWHITEPQSQHVLAELLLE